MTAPETTLRDLRRRRAVRRVGLIAGAVLLLPVVAVGAEVVCIYAVAYSATASYVSGDYPGTVQSSHGQEPFNFFEPYKSP